MIERTVEELTPIIGTRPACLAVGASVATIYRRRRPPEPKPARPRPTPDRALTEPERAAVLEVLHSERFVDVSPEETYATLLDEGTYLCATRTMYRILAAHHGGVRERRDQLRVRDPLRRGPPASPEPQPGYAALVFVAGGSLIRPPSSIRARLQHVRRSPFSPSRSLIPRW